MQLPQPFSTGDPQPAREDGKLLGIQVARGVAALLVALFHGGRMLRLYVNGILHGGIFDFGHAGVDFFFVLSGFIIYYVHQNDLGHYRRGPIYLWKRLTRVYPVYWLVSAYLIVVATFSSEAGTRLRPGYLIRSLLLIPQASEPLLGVAWTLTFEMFFYLVFLAWIMNQRLGQSILVIWLAVIGYCIVWPPISLPLKFLGSSFHLLFFAGIIAAVVVKFDRVRHPLRWMWLGIAGFFGTGLAEDLGLAPAHEFSTRCAYGIFAAMTILGIARAELLGRIQVSRLAAFAGAMSYSLYLVHVPVIALTGRGMAKIGLTHLLPGWSVLALTISCSVSIACLVHLFIERPIAQWSRRVGTTPPLLHSIRSGCYGLDTDQPGTSSRGWADPQANL